MQGTLCLTVDNLGNALAIGRGRAFRPDPCEPGLALGLPRALSLFKSLGLSATFFVEGWNGIHHPSAIAAMLEHGHEVALHGWVHERWAELSDEQQEVLLWDGNAALRMAGANPKGFRAPGGYRGSRTEELLVELGYEYDSSIEPGTEGDLLRAHALESGLAVVPWHWTGNDYWQYTMHPDGGRSPAQMLETWEETLKEVVADAGLMTVTLHPFVSFVDDERQGVVQRFLETALQTSGLRVVGASTLAASLNK
ncbi:polysaccharide deacetylase family protein [Arthrobacter sulfonylureivorans]|uniref:polysaccharide deacetylase family protein n=1 Tax=Arthrobacter sulfonylureivorans TaxID=2486855 RepID=UPI003BAED079